MIEELKPSELRIGNWVMFDPNELIEDPFAEPIPQYPFRIESGERIDLSVYGGYHPKLCLNPCYKFKHNFRASYIYFGIKYL